MSIRVGLIAPSLRLLGGHSVQAARLLEVWRGDDEVDVRLVPIDPTPPSMLAPLARVKFARTASTQLCYWPLLFRTLRQVDLVHVFCPSNSSFFRSSAPAIWIARRYGKPVIVNYRGDGREHLTRSRRARRLIRSADVIAVPSGYFQEIFREFDLPSQIVPNLADLSSFRYRVRDPLRPRFLSTRNLDGIYNVECTLRAFARVQQRYPDATLMIVGSGRDESRLRAWVNERNLCGVTFAGPVAPGAIAAFYDAADIYVQTPRIDNTPASLIEAFASGLPAVATRVGGVPLLLESGVHGLLASSDDDECVAAHMTYILEHPAEARRMAAQAAATCVNYEGTRVRELWRQVYRSLAGATVSARSRNYVGQN